MASNHRLVIVFYYHKTARYSANVLAGALGTNPTTNDIPLRFPTNFAQFSSEIDHYARCAKQVLAIWSFYSPDFAKMSVELDEIKTKIKANNIIHIAGGVHATAEPRATLMAGFDFAAQGEGEQLIIDIARRLSSEHSITDLVGLAFFRNGKFVNNGKTKIVDLESFPAFSAVHKKIGPIEITRGCIYACKFCQTPFINKAKFRHRSIENVIQHVAIMRELGSRDYRFLTPTALSYGTNDETVNLDAVEHLLAHVRETVGSNGRIFYGTFPSEVRPEHVSETSLRVLKKYVNNENLIIGGQSGSDTILEQSRRGHSVEDVIRAVRLCLDYGFIPNVDFLFGLPGESDDDRNLTRRLAQQLANLGARIHTHVFMPLPGTPFKNKNGGNVDEPTELLLLQLASQQQAYGPWQKQRIIARQLENMRNPIVDKQT